MSYENLFDGPKKRFLVTGAAGFIGSNLVETLLGLGQEVVALDNFLTGHKSNVERAVTESGSDGGNFTFIEADTRDPAACQEACRGVDVVLHQAALGSVPRSINAPLASHGCNVDGIVNMLWAAKENGVARFVYASSSSVYGDSPILPKVEDHVGRPLSPYALTKAINEQYADIFSRTYGLETIGLRYFNVFGKRQDPDGPYAAVIPRWIKALLAGRDVEIFGDGETTRDFCFIENVVQMNLLAGITSNPSALNRVYNVALGNQTSLNELYHAIEAGLARRGLVSPGRRPVYKDFRSGDIRHSLADVTAAKDLLGYNPRFDISDGLERCLDWYCANLAVG